MTNEPPKRDEYVKLIDDDIKFLEGLRAERIAKVASKPAAAEPITDDVTNNWDYLLETIQKERADHIAGLSGLSKPERAAKEVAKLVRDFKNKRGAEMEISPIRGPLFPRAPPTTSALALEEEYEEGFEQFGIELEHAIGMFRRFPELVVGEFVPAVCLDAFENIKVMASFRIHDRFMQPEQMLANAHRTLAARAQHLAEQRAQAEKARRSKRSIRRRSSRQIRAKPALAKRASA